VIFPHLSKTDLKFTIVALQINSGTPIVIDFWAEWCAPCKAVAPIFEKLSSTADPDVKFYKVNIDEQAQIAGELNISSVCLPNALPKKLFQTLSGF